VYIYVVKIARDRHGGRLCLHRSYTLGFFFGYTVLKKTCGIMYIRYVYVSEELICDG